MLDTEEFFDLAEACSCPGKRGNRARSKALQNAEGSSVPRDKGDLRELMSDPGVVW